MIKYLISGTAQLLPRKKYLWNCMRKFWYLQGLSAQSEFYKHSEKEKRENIMEPEYLRKTFFKKATKLSY